MLSCHQGRLLIRDSIPKRPRYRGGLQGEGCVIDGNREEQEGTSELVCLSRVEGRNCHL